MVKTSLAITHHRFYDWTNKVHREVLDLVKSRGLCVKREEDNYWVVYPYDVRDSLYEGDTNLIHCVVI